MSDRSPQSGSPLAGLVAQGQSLWLDYMHRRMLRGGELHQLIETRAIRGATSNPTIFEQAIGRSEAYDEEISRLAAAGKEPLEIYETLALEDIREACDVFAPVYRESGGNDGFVSLEVSPRLAHDTEGTIAEARRLWAALDRPNAMIKIPGTAAGLPAISQALSEGINVNVTLLFAVGMYQRVIDAYLTGLERRLEAGQPVDRVRSVASFFVSRVDTETDKRLEALAARGGDRVRLDSLLGKAAVANARLAYAAFGENFSGSRFRTLKDRGAAVQRPLWASTGTKNPSYSDTLYVDSLIGPDTVNTLPPATLEAFADHGHPARTIDKDLEAARGTITAIEAAGVSLGDVTDFLVADGVKKFADSFDSLIAAVEQKRAKLAAA